MNTTMLILIIIGACVGVSLLLGFMDIPPFNQLSNMVSGWLGGFDFKSVLSNPATILTVVGGIAAVGIPLLSKVNEYKTKAQVTATQAQTQISQYSNALSETSGKLATSNFDLTKAQETILKLQGTTEGATKQVAQLEKEKDKLLIQLEALNNIQAKAVVLAENKEVVRTIVA